MRVDGTVIRVLTIAILGLLSAVPANADPGLIREWYRLDGLCRGTSAGEGMCERREAVGRRLEARGLCYSGSIGADTAWRRCADGRAAGPPLGLQGSGHYSPGGEDHAQRFAETRTWIEFQSCAERAARSSPMMVPPDFSAFEREVGRQCAAARSAYIAAVRQRGLSQRQANETVRARYREFSHSLSEQFHDRQAALFRQTLERQAQDAHLAKINENRAQHINCLEAAVPRLALGTGEPADVVVAAAFGLCRGHEDEFRSLLRQSPGGALPHSEETALVTLRRNRARERLLALILAIRSAPPPATRPATPPQPAPQERST